ncbi:MAG: hypothetical protein OEZ58_23325 [Gammaproteobacteria bacterium]|nr:hypothetical protein [Gammaproteobacteria bacterium]
MFKSNSENAKTQLNLNHYVSVDEACLNIFPMLIKQLEIVNSQMQDGVSALVGGFAVLAKSIDLVNSTLNGKRIGADDDHSFEQKLEKVKRFTDDLVQAGEAIHQSATSDVTERILVNADQEQTQHIHRIILRTLGIQQLSSEIHNQAHDIIHDIKTMSGDITHSDHPQKQALQNIFIDMQTEVHKMIVAFQFQDRVSQIIHGVLCSMRDFTDYIREASARARMDDSELFVNLSELVDLVEKYYISKEQYQLSNNEHSIEKDVMFF